MKGMMGATSGRGLVHAMWRALSTVTALTVLLTVSGSTAAAADARGQAAEQVKSGLKAAGRGYWLEALMRFEQANTLTPDDPHILNNVAVALEAAGRFEQALVAYQSALAIAPKDRVLQRNYKLFKDFYDENVAAAVTEEGSAGDEAGDGVAPVGKEDHEAPTSR